MAVRRFCWEIVQAHFVCEHKVLGDSVGWAIVRARLVCQQGFCEQGICARKVGIDILRAGYLCAHILV